MALTRAAYQLAVEPHARVTRRYLGLVEKALLQLVDRRTHQRRERGDAGVDGGPACQLHCSEWRRRTRVAR
jgi:hypothetical protein